MFQRFWCPRTWSALIRLTLRSRLKQVYWSQEQFGDRGLRPDSARETRLAVTGGSASFEALPEIDRSPNQLCERLPMPWMRATPTRTNIRGIRSGYSERCRYGWDRDLCEPGLNLRAVSFLVEPFG